ncbi:MAG: FAD-linked oxidase C-terminal domain-containing protein, partial [bacterium]
DMAVPDKGFDEMFHAYYDVLGSCGMDNLVFGHIGENHLHVNILPKTEEEVIKAKAIYLDLVKRAVELGGTPSAEHGIGKLKHVFLKEMVGQAGLDEMVRVKKVLDPACILGRGNVFPQELLG